MLDAEIGETVEHIFLSILNPQGFHCSIVANRARLCVEVKPDAIAFNCVLDVCVKAGDIHRGRQLVQEMKETLSNVENGQFLSTIQIASCRGAKAYMSGTAADKISYGL